MLRNILFDLDETIYDFGKSEKTALFETMSYFGIECSDSIVNMYSQINNSQWKLLEKGMLTREELKIRRFKLLYDELGVNCSPSDTNEYYTRKLSEKCFFVNGARELLQRLYGKYRLYIVSNGFSFTQRGRINSGRISEFFSDVFISQDIGFDKPSVEFFEKCFSRIPEFEKTETIIIGDSLTSDIKGGINAGITTVWFNPSYALNSSECIPDYEIHSLYDLDEILININADDLTGKLFAMQDAAYKDFHSKLIPNVEKDKIIGVRVPDIRRLAKQCANTNQGNDFIRKLPHEYYDEYNLHGFIIEKIKDYNDCINEINKLLPYIDNWATCDMISPAVLKSNTEKLLKQIYIWIASKHTYTVRFGIGMLMRYYLDECFKPEYLEKVSIIKSDEYYINMMIAWFFATALSKQYNHAVTYIQDHKLPAWIHNKAIQKAVESRRITPEQKSYLKSLKVRL